MSYEIPNLLYLIKIKSELQLVELVVSFTYTKIINILT